MSHVDQYQHGFFHKTGFYVLLTLFGVGAKLNRKLESYLFVIDSLVMF